MGVVVDERHAVVDPAHVEPAPDAAEAPEGTGRIGGRRSERLTHGHRADGVEHVVHPAQR